MHFLKERDGSSTIVRQRSVKSTKKQPGESFLQSQELVESTTETEISKEVNGIEYTTAISQNRKVEVRPKTSCFTWFMMILFFLVVVATTLFIAMNPSVDLRGDWPPSPSLVLVIESANAN